MATAADGRPAAGPHRSDGDARPTADTTADTPAADTTAARLFAGPGEARALGRACDWAATALGPAADWPAALATLVPVVMASAFPSALLWGPAMVFVYNDAYAPLLGAAHPHAFGRAAPAHGPAGRDALAPRVARVRAGETVVVADEPAAGASPGAPAARGTYSASYAPVRGAPDPVGPVLGVYVQAVETTTRVALRAAEAARRRVEARADALIANLPGAAVFVVDHDLRYVLAGGEGLGAAGLAPADFVGRAVADAVPPEAAASYEALYRGALGGRAFAHEHPVNGRVYASRGVPLRDADGRVEAALAVSYDVTGRRAAEDAARVAGVRHAFLLRLGDTLRPLADPVAVQAAAAGALGAFLGASRAFYTEVAPDGDHAVIHRDYADGVPSIAGEIRIGAFGAFLAGAYRGGRTVAVADAAGDARFADRERATLAAAHIGAFVGVPLVKAGRLAAVFGVNASGARAWTADEVALVEDVAERTWAAVGRARAEAALRASDARFRALVEHLPDYAIFGLDAAGLATAWTLGAERVTGYAAEEIAGRPLATFYTPDDVAAGVPAHELAVAAAAGRGEWEGWRVRKDGSRFWANEIATAVHDAGGRVIGFTKISRDLTERRRAEDALRASEARFRAVANVVPDLLWQSAPDGGITWYNDRWYAYTGLTPEAAAGTGWAAVVHPDDLRDSMAAFADARAERRAFAVEQRMRRADGAHRWFLVRCAPVLGEDGAVVQWFGAAADVHAGRAARDEVEAQVVERTAELAEANGRLAAEVAARARAQAARTALQRRLASAEDAERRHLARELHDEAGQHLTALGLGLGALAEVTASGSEAGRRVGALRELADTLGRELHALAVRLRPRALDDFGLEAALAAYADAWAAQTGIAADVHTRVVAERLAPPVESAVYRIVQEALTNVARHSGATRAGVVVERRDGHVVVTVEDDGRGFDVRALRTAGAAGAGGGLGLAGVRERAALLGGTVDVESAPGAGTTLFVRVPMAPTDDAERGAAADGWGEPPDADDAAGPGAGAEG